MKIDTEDMVTATELNRNASRYLADIREGRRQRIVVMKDNAPAAFLVGTEEMAQLQQLEEQRRDLQLLCLFLMRITTDSGKLHDLDDVVAELGIDED